MNDPWAEPGNRSAAGIEVEAVTSQYVAAGLDPLDAADLVLAGVRSRELWIFAARDPESVHRMLNPVWPDVR